MTATWNFADVWESVAEAAPDAVAQRHGAKAVSWREFDAAANGVARGLLDAREVKVLSRLDAITAEQPSVFPEGEVADAAKAGLGRGTKVRDRKKVCDLVPELGAALAAGSTTGDRVDAVAKATSGLSEGERAAVAEQGAVIAAAAASATDRQFREVVERIVGESRQHDGREQLSRQRSASRLRWWSGADGMWNLAGSLDPVRGAEAEEIGRAHV